MGRGGGQVVSVLTFYSDNLSSNPTVAYTLFCNICVGKEQKLTKRGRFGTFKKEVTRKF